MKTDPKIECPTCHYWTRSPRPKERFWFLWGFYEFDIELAKKIVADGRIPVEFPVQMLGPIVRWPSTEVFEENTRQGELKIKMGVSIDPRHLDHVDPGVPIIIGTPAGELRKMFISNEPIIILDGYDRLGRAVKQGRSSILGYVQTERPIPSVGSAPGIIQLAL